MARDWELTCRNCGVAVIGQHGSEDFDHAVERPCDWDNCTVVLCHECGHRVTTWGVGRAGYPDCPCFGGKVPSLRWPWTSERFVDAYCGYHMWAFGIRLSNRWWRYLLTPVPFLLFGDFTGAQYHDARLHNPEYFRRKRVTPEVPADGS